MYRWPQNWKAIMVMKTVNFQNDFIILGGINPQTGTTTQFTTKLNKRWLIHLTLAISEVASCLLFEVAPEMIYYAEAPQKPAFSTLTFLQHSTLYCAYFFLSSLESVCHSFKMDQ